MTYSEALAYLKTELANSGTMKFPGEIGIARLTSLLREQGNPQQKLRVIHVAGTSGKGSTAGAVATLLRAHGFKVGLHVSPHLIDIRERFQIGGKFISKEKFAEIVEKLHHSQQQVSYFEALVFIALQYFADEEIDYAVIEVGVGGLYDASNISGYADKLSVLSMVGLAHMHILGHTLAEIATQKTGIFPGSYAAVSAVQVAEVQKIAEVAAHELTIPLTTLQEVADFSGHVNGGHLYFNYPPLQLQQLDLGHQALYQMGNYALALRAVQLVARQHGWSVDPAKAAAALQGYHHQGRWQFVRIDGHEVLLDGAHNPQKLAGLLESLQAYYPGQKFQFIFADKQSERQAEMLAQLEPHAQSLVLLTNDEVETWLAKLKQTPTMGSSLPLVVTGSLALVGEFLRQLTTQPTEV